MNNLQDSQEPITVPLLNRVLSLSSDKLDIADNEEKKGYSLIKHILLKNMRDSVVRARTLFGFKTEAPQAPVVTGFDFDDDDFSIPAADGNVIIDMSNADADPNDNWWSDDSNDVQDLNDNDNVNSSFAVIDDEESFSPGPRRPLLPPAELKPANVFNEKFENNIPSSIARCGRSNTSYKPSSPSPLSVVTTAAITSAGNTSVAASSASAVAAGDATPGDVSVTPAAASTAADNGASAVADVSEDTTDVAATLAAITDAVVSVAAPAASTSVVAAPATSAGVRAADTAVTAAATSSAAAASSSSVAATATASISSTAAAASPSAAISSSSAATSTATAASAPTAAPALATTATTATTASTAAITTTATANATDTAAATVASHEEEDKENVPSVLGKRRRGFQQTSSKKALKISSSINTSPHQCTTYSSAPTPSSSILGKRGRDEDEPDYNEHCLKKH